MIKLFFSYFTNTLNLSLFVLLFLLLEPILKKRYSSKCIYSIWVVLLFGFLIPVRYEIVQPIFHFEVLGISTDNHDINSTNSLLYEGSENTNEKNLSEQPSISNKSSSTDTVLTTKSHFIRQSPSVIYSFIIRNKYLVICFLWLLGGCLLFAFNGISFLRYKKRIERYLLPADKVIMPEEIKQSIQKSNRNIRIYQCSVISSPMSIGILRPSILLPDRPYSERDLYYLLQHELTHIRRMDSLIKLIVLITLSLNWFNPLCFILAKHIDYWCEASCDALVLEKCSKSECMYYSKLLLSSAASMTEQHCPALFTNFYGGKNNMKQRLYLILNLSKKRSGKLILFLLLIMLLTITTITFGKSNAQAFDQDKASASTDAEITPELQANNKNNISTDLSDSQSNTVSKQSDFELSKNNSKANASDIKADADSSGEIIVSYALYAKENNTQYVWGGNDLETGVDCSGFVQAIYKKADYDLPRTSREQFSVCKEIQFDQLQSGDLVFYISDTNIINHVGIYIGGGKIIHAINSRDDLVISDFNYRQPYRCGRIIF